MFAVQREALPCDFVDLADDYECVRIDFVDQRIDGRQFALLDDAQRRLLLGSLVGRLDVHHRQPDILHIQQCLFDFLELFGNDEKLHLIRTGHHDFIDDDGRQEHHDEPVKDLFHIGKERLDQQENDIECVHAHRQRKLEVLVQQQRRNVHPTRGCAGPEYQTHAQPAEDARVDRRQQDIIGHVLQSLKRPEKSQKSRKYDCAHDCRQSELLPQQYRPDNKHEAVENQHDQGNVQSKKMIQNNGKTRRSPSNQILRQNECRNRKGNDDIPRDNRSYRF